MHLRLILLFSLISSPVFAREVIRVGAYHFPPYAVADQMSLSGVVTRTIEILNKSSKKFFFKLVPTSSKRRFQDLNEKKYDLILFESKNWGWDEAYIDYLSMNLDDGEYYVALKQSGRDQSFFKDIKKKSISAVLGYHYGFADFNADQDYLKRNFDIVLSTSHKKNLERVKKGRSDITIVTKSYFNLIKNQKPDYKELFFTSDKYDQKYNIGVIMRKGVHFSKDDLKKLLDHEEFKLLRSKLGI